jgi:hypothetical protein
MPAPQNWQAIVASNSWAYFKAIMDRCDFRSDLKFRDRRDIMRGAELPDSWTGL